MSNDVRDLLAQCKPGFTLPQAMYRNPEIYEHEVEQIFMRNWIFAGHVSQVPQPGDFFTYALAQESVIITRNRSGEVVAFANVCRHRGSRLCLEQTGSVTAFTCPYHAWAYDIDGRLISAREMDGDFDKQLYSLNPVQLEVIEGLVFISLSGDSPSLEDAKRDLREPLRIFGVEGLKLAEKRSYTIGANWKLAVENYHECYHCGPAHPEYAKLHTLKLDSSRLEKMQGHMLERMSSCGIKHIEFDHQHDWARPGQQGYAYSRTALFPGCQTGSPKGSPVAPLLGNISDYDSGASDFSVGPFSFFLAYSDHIVAYVFKPLSVSKCVCEIFWWVHPEADEGVDYSKEELTWLWDVTTKADERIIINNQKGVNSRFYKPGPYSKMEHWTRRSTEWILNRLAEG